MPKNGNPEVAILYWGTRGGPVRQLTNLIKTSVENELSFEWILSSNIVGFTKLPIGSCGSATFTDLPKSKMQIVFNLVKRRRAVTRILEYLKNQNIRRIFILLPHPWDTYLAKRLYRETKIEIWRGVHDLNRHPGEFWPSRWAIRRTLKYSHVWVTFSRYTTTHLTGQQKKIVETSIYEPQTPSAKEAPSGSVLFIGRVRKYKGLPLLKEAWPLVKNKNKFLTVAGEGKGNPFKSTDGIKVIDRWLSDNEIDELIRMHQVVVLPYTEASQSGVISIANARGVPVVVTPVGGLVTQVIQGKTGLIVNGLNPQDLAKTIDEALTTQWNIEVSKLNPLHEFLVSLKL